MCSSIITRISVDIISSLEKLSGLSLSDLQGSGESMSLNEKQQAALKVFLSALDMINLPELSPKDLEAINGVLKRALPMLNKLINREQAEWTKSKRIDEIITESYRTAVGNLSRIGWFDIKNELIVAYSQLFE